MSKAKQLYILSKYVHESAEDATGSNYIVDEYACTVSRDNKPEDWFQTDDQGSWWCVETYDNIEDVANELAAHRGAEKYKCNLQGCFSLDDIAYLTKRNLLVS